MNENSGSAFCVACSIISVMCAVVSVSCAIYIVISKFHALGYL